MMHVQRRWRALGDTVAPLIILAVSVGLNIAGDLFFILVLHAGVYGAAVATVLSQVLVFVICWIYMIRRYEILQLKKTDFTQPEKEMLGNMAASGLSMGFMSSLVNIGSLTFRRRLTGLDRTLS